MKEPTIVVVATPEEVKLAKDILGTDASHILVTGVGGTNVIRSLQGLDRQTRLINIGYAGSVDLPIGQRVEINEVSLFHNCDYQEDEMHMETPFLGVHCFTGTDFITSSDKTGCVFDMELAFIAAMGFKKLRSIKVVSDHLDYTEYEKNSNSYGK